MPSSMARDVVGIVARIRVHAGYAFDPRSSVEVTGGQSHHGFAAVADQQDPSRIVNSAGDPLFLRRRSARPGRNPESWLPSGGAG